MLDLYKPYYLPVYDSCMFSALVMASSVSLSWDDVYIGVDRRYSLAELSLMLFGIEGGANNHLITQTLKYISKCSN